MGMGQKQLTITVAAGSEEAAEMSIAPLRALSHSAHIVFRTPVIISEPEVLIAFGITYFPVHLSNITDSDHALELS